MAQRTPAVGRGRGGAGAGDSERRKPRRDRTRERLSVPGAGDIADWRVDVVENVKLSEGASLAWHDAALLAMEAAFPEPVGSQASVVAASVNALLRHPTLAVRGFQQWSLALARHVWVQLRVVEGEVRVQFGAYVVPPAAELEATLFSGSDTASAGDEKFERLEKQVSELQQMQETMMKNMQQSQENLMKNMKEMMTTKNDSVPTERFDAPREQVAADRRRRAQPTELYDSCLANQVECAEWPWANTTRSVRASKGLLERVYGRGRLMVEHVESIIDRKGITDTSEADTLLLCATALDNYLTHDQVNLLNTAGSEVLCRRIIGLEEALRPVTSRGTLSKKTDDLRWHDLVGFCSRDADLDAEVRAQQRDQAQLIKWGAKASGQTGAGAVRE